jgi:prepilin-type processing-associated H-X9-DG protein
MNNAPYDVVAEVVSGNISSDFVNAIDSDLLGAPDDGIIQRIVDEWAANLDDSVFNDDVTLGDKTAYRLREGIERFLITDINNPAGSAMAQSELFVMQDDLQSANPDMMNHVPGGCNILYMDGHVEFERYPGSLPVSRAWAVVMGMLMT